LTFSQRHAPEVRVDQDPGRIDHRAHQLPFRPLEAIARVGDDAGDTTRFGSPDQALSLGRYRLPRRFSAYRMGNVLAQPRDYLVDRRQLAQPSDYLGRVLG
jgi:hypothetical protein